MQEDPEPVSETSARPNRTLPIGKQWVAHSGKQARMRYIRQFCNKILKSQDLEVIDVIKRADQLVSRGVHHDYGVLLVINTARETSESTGIGFVATLSYMLDKLEETPIETDDPSTKESA